MTTWKEIKLYTLQKMFAADGSNIPTDDSTKDYIAGMPATANEALQMLSTVGKFIIKRLDIAHNPVSNLLSDSAQIKSVERGSIEYMAKGVHSLYFEAFGGGEYEIYVGDTLFSYGSLTKSKGYVDYRFLVTNDNDEVVKLVLTSKYPLAVKNVGMYSADFETVEEVQPFAEKVKYNLKEMVDDFYMLDTTNIFFEDEKYSATSDYLQEGNTVLVLDRDKPGNYLIYYKAYPQKITFATEDDYVLPIDDEVASIIPLYMASELYKDDDAGIATGYRNEFEIAFERLKNAPKAPSAESFVSESGWI